MTTHQREYSRDVRRAAERIERRSLRSGVWAAWTHHDLPTGLPGSRGWCSEVRGAAANGLYAVLRRPLGGGAEHWAIRTPTNLEPPWRDLQRIKNELAGPDRVALQVCPPADLLVDDADMYHLWVMPPGWSNEHGLDGRRMPR